MQYGKISVILPVWKPNLIQLKQCLDSIADQTYDNLEIIIIYQKSDKFDSDFQSLLSEYHDEKRLKILQNKTIGLASSLNLGISSCVGDYIGRIDQDDYCKVERFQEQLDFKHKNNINIVGSWAYRISNYGKIIGKIELPVTHSEIRKKMMLHCPMLHPTILMDKKMLNEIGYYDISFDRAEDYELYFRAMSKGYTFGNVPEHLCYIRESLSSITRGSEWRKQRKNYMKAKNKAFNEYGFVKPLDRLYHFMTPFSYFMSPKAWSKFKKITGWEKSN